MRQAIVQRQSFLERHRIKVPVKPTVDSSAVPQEPAGPIMTLSVNGEAVEPFAESAPAETAVATADTADLQMGSGEDVIEAYVADPLADVAADRKRSAPASQKARGVEPAAGPFYEAPADGGDEDDLDQDADARLDDEDPEVSDDEMTEAAYAAVRSSSSADANVNSTSVFLNKLHKYPPLPVEECLALIEKAQAGSESAMAKLVNHHLRLVVYVARGYLRRGGANLDDMVQDGSLGLMRGIMKFDASFGIKPSSYFPYWIRRNIKRAIQSQSGPVVIPEHVHQNASKLQSAALAARAAGASDADELQRRSDAAYDQIRRLRDQIPVLGPGERDDDWTTASISHMLIDECDVEATVSHRQTLALFVQAANELPPRSRFIVAVKCDLIHTHAEELDLEGWIDDNGLLDFVEAAESSDRRAPPLQSIGEALGISGERVNQIFQQSLEAIKSEMEERVGSLDLLSVPVAQSTTRSKAQTPGN